MTLTTCNPRWASYERLIFHAELVDELPKADGRPEALGGGEPDVRVALAAPPRPTAVRLVIALVLFVGLVAVLFLWVFPWLEPRLPFTDVTVDEARRQRAAYAGRP